MPALDGRIRALETTTAAAAVCQCPLTIQVIDYRAGIADDGGAGAVPELCPRCGKATQVIRIAITGDAGDMGLESRVTL
jgi:hypothetical protein